jgi:hypothetical protein
VEAEVLFKMTSHYVHSTVCALDSHAGEIGDRQEKISHPHQSDPCGGARRPVCAPEKRIFHGSRFYAIRNYQAGLFFDVTPDFHKIYRRLRSKNIAYAHLGLAFQLC